MLCARASSSQTSFSKSQNVHLAICVCPMTPFSFPILFPLVFPFLILDFRETFFLFTPNCCTIWNWLFFANRDFQDGRRPRWVPLGLLSVIHVPFYHKFWKTKTPILPALLLKLLSSDSLRSLLTRPKSSIFMGRSWSFANTVKKNLLQISDGPTLFLWK